MRSGHAHPRHGLIAAGNYVFDVQPQVWKSADQHLEVLEHAGLRRRQPRQFLVLDEIIGEQSSETVEVTGVDGIVKLSD